MRRKLLHFQEFGDYREGEGSGFYSVKAVRGAERLFPKIHARVHFKIKERLKELCLTEAEVWRHYCWNYWREWHRFENYSSGVSQWDECMADEFFKSKSDLETYHGMMRKEFMAEIHRWPEAAVMWRGWWFHRYAKLTDFEGPCFDGLEKFPALISLAGTMRNVLAATRPSAMTPSQGIIRDRNNDRRH